MKKSPVWVIFVFVGAGPRACPGGHTPILMFAWFVGAGPRACPVRIPQCWFVREQGRHGDLPLRLWSGYIGVVFILVPTRRVIVGIFAYAIQVVIVTNNM